MKNKKTKIKEWLQWVLSKKSRIENKGSQEDEAMGFEHKIINGIGVFKPSNDGEKATYTSWESNHSRYKVGDRVLYTSRKGQEARYIITEYDPKTDPSDMFSLELKFHPRWTTNK